jgi:hypothetical protein
MRYEGWKGDKIDAYFGHLDQGEWVKISWFKYHRLKWLGYIVRKVNSDK